MVLRTYTIRDLEVTDELSGQFLLCRRYDDNKTVWASSRFFTDLSYTSLCDIDEAFKQGYFIARDEGQGTFVYTDETLDHARYFRYTQRPAVVEGISCAILILSEESWEVFHETSLATDERTNRIPCGIFSIRIEHHKLYCEYNNTYFYKVLGYEPTELSREDMLSTRIIHSDDRTRLQEEIFHYTKQGTTGFELEYRVLKKDGSYSWMMARVVPDLYPNHYLVIVLDNTRQKELVNRLRISEEEKRIVLQQGKLYILRYEVKNKVLHIRDDGALQMEKYRRVENFPDCFRHRDLVKEETFQEFMDFFYAMQKGDKEGEAIFQQRLYHKSEYRWVKAKFTMIYDEQGNPDIAIISYEDYSDIYEKELAYERWISEFEQKKKETIAYYEYNLTKDKFETLEGKLSDSLPKSERNSFTYIAHYAADHFVSPVDRKKYLKVFSREYLLEQYEKGRRHLSLQHRRLDDQGREFWALGEIRMIWDPYASIVKASVLLYDIDDEKRKAIELKKMSETDSLTGLYNRGTLFRRMESTLHHSGKNVRHVMILIDLNYFKNLNDTYGHQYGDKTLLRVAKTIRSCCRGEDICSRIGGDEFVIFMRNMAMDTDIHEKLEMLKKAIAEPDDEGRRITASIGAAYYPEDGRDASSLYRKADEEMYQAKRKEREQ